MKALVLAGGLPQADLIEKLKMRGVGTVLADYYEQPVARGYADVFYQVSTLDVDAIRDVARKEKVDFLITVCTDQALLTVARVSEDLKLPCYISYETARNVTNKAYMKDVLWRHKIPTARYKVLSTLEEGSFDGWAYPLVVKPVDCNSSKGVRKVCHTGELKSAFSEAAAASRTSTAIVEEYMEGLELSVDVYVEDGQAIVLDITESEKIRDSEKFIICRTWHMAQAFRSLAPQVAGIAQQIAEAFHIENAPMLLQVVSNGGKLSVIELSARTGGGVKHLSIQRQAGVDVISAVIGLTMGERPRIQAGKPRWEYMLDEYIYCIPGTYSHLAGFEEMKRDGLLLDYYEFRWKGAEFGAIGSSGDRVGGFTIVADSIEELAQKHIAANAAVKVVSAQGADIMRHDLLADFRNRAGVLGKQ